MRIGEMVSTMQRMVNAMNNFNALAQKSAQRLATGKRVNSVADDPSAIGRINRLDSAIRANKIYQSNINNGISLVKTMDSALKSMEEAGKRLAELAVRYNNSSISAAEKTQIEEEAKAYLDEIKNTLQNTEFNGIKVFQTASYNIFSSSGTVTVDTPKFKIESGATAGTYIITDNSGNTLSDKTVNEILTSDFVNKNIVEPIAQARSQVGVRQTILENRLNFEKEMEAIQVEALSNIEDVDVAEENMQLTKYQTLAALNSKMLASYSYQMYSTIGQLLDMRI